MKPGSIVKCVRYFSNRTAEHTINYPEVNKDYTVKGVITSVYSGRIFITLEEVVNPAIFKSEYGTIETHFAADHFRELLPPEAMQEQIKELLEEPVMI